MMRPWGFLGIGLLALVFASPSDLQADNTHHGDVRLIKINAAQSGPVRRSYIQSYGEAEEPLIALRRKLIDEGVQRVNLFLPSGIIVCDVPESMDLARLIDDPRFSFFDESEVDMHLVADRSGDLHFVKRCYERSVVSPPPTAAPPGPDGFEDLLLTVPPDVLEASKQAVRLSAVSGSVPERTIEQNSEFLVGDILVQLVLPESVGHGEDWTAGVVADAVSGAFAAALDCQAKFGYARIHFVLKSVTDVPTSYEPIRTTMEHHVEWIHELMQYIGIAEEKSIDLMVHEFNNQGRRYYDTDWAFTAFIVNSENAPNHRFADQFYTAYAYLGGPCLVIPYPAGENPFEIDPWLVFSTIFQHEMMHIFWALDEYPAEINMSQCGTLAGYLAYPNMNKITQLMNGSLVGCPGQDMKLCIMWRAKEELGRPMCRFTQGQIGVIDADGNSVPDVFEEAPAVIFENTAVETIQTPDVTIRMKAISRAVPNVNPMQDRESRVSYAPPLKDAVVTINGAGSIRLDPEDGRWDEIEEDLSISLTGISVGMTQIGVTIRHVFGKSSPSVVKKVYFAGIRFAQLDLSHFAEGIGISWSTVGETFGARLDLHRVDVSSGAADTEVLVENIQPTGHLWDIFHQYVYIDSDVIPGHSYRYFITGSFEIDYGGNLVEYRDTSTVLDADAMFAIPSGSLSSHASPNPFNESMQITVRVPDTYTKMTGDPGSSSYGVPIPQQTEVNITVYDVAGRPVKEIFNGRVYGGMKMFVWDGTNRRGDRLPSGVYFVKTIAGPAAEVKKVVIIR